MERLTTGQMLDQLGLEDVATNQNGWHVGYDHKGNLLMWPKGEEKPLNEEGNRFQLYYPYVKRDSWVINYHFVDYEEAIRAHNTQKKTVILYQSEDLQYRFVYGEYGQFERLAKDGIELRELFTGKWIIEN